MTGASDGIGAASPGGLAADANREPDLAVLRFLRWLAEEGRSEHALAGYPTGEWAEFEQERCRP